MAVPAVLCVGRDDADSVMRERRHRWALLTLPCGRNRWLQSRSVIFSSDKLASRSLQICSLSRLKHLPGACTHCQQVNQSAGRTIDWQTGCPESGCWANRIWWRYCASRQLAGWSSAPGVCGAAGPAESASNQGSCRKSQRPMSEHTLSSWCQRLG